MGCIHTVNQVVSYCAVFHSSLILFYYRLIYRDLCGYYLSCIIMLGSLASDNLSPGNYAILPW